MAPSGGYKGIRAYKIYSPDTGKESGLKWHPAYRRYYASLDPIDAAAEVTLLKSRLSRRYPRMQNWSFNTFDSYLRDPEHEMQLYSARRRRGGYEKLF